MLHSTNAVSDAARRMRARFKLTAGRCSRRWTRRSRMLPSKTPSRVAGLGTALIAAAAKLTNERA